MRQLPVQKLSGWLVCVLVILLCLDILAIPLAPAFAYLRAGNPEGLTFASLAATFDYDFDDGLGNLLRILLRDTWQTPRIVVLALFLMVCGICGAVILVQGIRLLASVADGAPFSVRNARCLHRAAAGCFVIAGAALVKTLCGCHLLASLRPWLTYTALFIPLFVMLGLCCLVAAGLFRQAAEVKAENDMII